MHQNREDRVSLKMMISIINPGAVFLSSFLPALTGILFAAEMGFSPDPFLCIVLLFIAVLSNSVADLLNDYFDYVNGTDKADDTVTPEDSPLAYHNISNPSPVLYTAIIFTAIILGLGAIVVVKAGIIPLIIAIIGLSVMLLYSGKYISLSAYPLGEVLAGGCLGGLIPLGVYVSLTGILDFTVIWKSVPMILMVSGLCLCNNSCDIERDSVVSRRTIPILIGRENAIRLSNILSCIWIGQFVIVSAAWFTFGMPVTILVLISISGALPGLFKNKRTFQDKQSLMLSYAKVALPISIGYPLTILMHILVKNIIL